MASHLMFVYGTLKSGEPNHALLEPPNNATLIGTAVTVDCFPLVIASRYNIPYVLDAAGTGKHIYGEVYRVDQACLDKLDELEEHPDYYERQPVDVRLTITNSSDLSCAVGSVLTCSMYLLRNFQDKLLELPVHETYSSSGDHGLPYCFREDREISTDYSTRDDVKKVSV